jgi:hypothetical protein
VLFIFFYRFFNDKITKNKEEFNILICSWLKIMNLHVSRISNIRWKNKNFFITSKPRSNLPKVGCVRGANTFPNHNQSLTRESLIRPVHPGFLVTLNEILGGDSQQSSKHNENHQRTPRGDVRQKQTKYITLYSTLQIRHLNQDFKARGLLNLTSM